MKKILFASMALTAVLAAPAHAISDKYRTQLERSGCTQATDGHGCDIHKTKAQNAAAAHTGAHTSDFSPFVGTWEWQDTKGKVIDTFTVTKTSVKTDGHLVEQAKVADGRLTFRVQAAEFTMLPEGFGSWMTSSQSGSLKRR
ncbi:TPA: hypothetical protein ACF7ZB_000187 [Kluyvera georgiana]